MTKLSLYNAGYVELLDSMGGDEAIVRGARICFQTESDPRYDKGLIKMLVREEHTSPLEQCTLTYKMKIPLFVRDQLVRHRIGMSYNIKSLRYCEASPEFFAPFFGDTQLSDTWKKDNEESFDRYMKWKDAFLYLGYKKGRAQELARCHLPSGIYTEIVLTCNMGSMYHFWKLRLDPHAQQEIRELAVAMLELVKDVAPTTYQCISDKFALEEN